MAVFLSRDSFEVKLAFLPRLIISAAICFVSGLRCFAMSSCLSRLLMRVASWLFLSAKTMGGSRFRRV